jgi:hypothetical protein
MADLSLDVNTTDPEALAKVFEQIESGQDLQTSDNKPVENPQDETAGTSNKEQQAEQGQTDQSNEAEEAAGIATKDGKHVIPYSVLKSERERATRAEQLAQEMKERVEALEAMVKSGNQGAKDGESARTDQQTPAADQLSKEDLESLKEDFPTVYKAVMASMAKAQALEAKLQPVEETVRNAQEDQARTAADTVQDAIDSVPKLAHIQANNPEAFELAKEFDANLRALSAWAGRSLAERFQKVSEMVEAAIGPIEIPGAKPTSQPSAEDLRKAAIARASSASKRDVPTSLSEFPAGQAPATDERAAVEQLSALQLAEKFSKMSSDDMDAYFRAL